jgi:voltage-gated potassium channel
MNLFSRILKTINWEKPPKPDKKIIPSIYPHLKPFRLPLILTILITVIGTIGYVIIDNMSVMDALYQTGITFTTVGFGEIAPISQAGRLFTINLIITGFAIFSLAVGILINEINKGYILDVYKERSMLYQVARLKQHYIVCYHNDYTIEVTKELRANHIPFVVIDPSEEISKWAKKYRYQYFLQAHPHSDEGMLIANIKNAKGVIALCDLVAENIALVASIRLFEKENDIKNHLHIISTAKTKDDMEKLKKLGSDVVINPKELTAKKVGFIALRPQMQNVFDEILYKDIPALAMEEITIPKESWIVSKSLNDANIREKTNCSVIGFTKKDGNFISMPKGDTIITSESKLLVIGHKNSIKAVKELINKIKK